MLGAKIVLKVIQKTFEKIDRKIIEQLCQNEQIPLTATSDVEPTWVAAGVQALPIKLR